jgi:hypothetical protein
MKADSEQGISRRAVLAPAVFAPLLAPLSASAVYRPPLFGGKYTDPKHPGCTRTMAVRGNDITITGFDEPSGPVWKVKGIVEDPKGTLSIDFTPKGGPTGVKATWTGDGLAFPDGNVWGKLPGKSVVLTNGLTADRYFDKNLLGSEYKFSIKEGQIYLKASDGIGAEKKWEAVGSAIGSDIFLDMSSKGEKAIVTGTRGKDGSLEFSNGMKWVVQSVFSGGAR